MDLLHCGFNIISNLAQLFLKVAIAIIHIRKYGFNNNINLIINYIRLILDTSNYSGAGFWQSVKTVRVL
jgi:hypothetical protein